MGKAFYYSRGYDGIVFADDSGLVVPALGGAPGVLSARYAGPGASSEQKIDKLLFEMKRLEGANRSAYFVCVIAAVRAGRAIAVVSETVDGEILEAPCGRRRRASIAIGERRSGGCWKFWSEEIRFQHRGHRGSTEFAEKRGRWQRRNK
jgi:hypothetical protein